jgi:hypothetical protein
VSGCVWSFVVVSGFVWLCLGGQNRLALYIYTRAYRFGGKGIRCRHWRPFVLERRTEVRKERDTRIQLHLLFARVQTYAHTHIYTSTHTHTRAHRRAMLNAASIAGLNVLRLMNETTV